MRFQENVRSWFGREKERSKTEKGAGVELRIGLVVGSCSLNEMLHPPPPSTEAAAPASHDVTKNVMLEWRIKNERKERDRTARVEEREEKSFFFFSFSEPGAGSRSQGTFEERS